MGVAAMRHEAAATPDRDDEDDSAKGVGQTLGARLTVGSMMGEVQDAAHRRRND